MYIPAMYRVPLSSRSGSGSTLGAPHIRWVARTAHPKSKPRGPGNTTASGITDCGPFVPDPTFMPNYFAFCGSVLFAPCCVAFFSDAFY